jgi:O-antigen ligase/polysaccharide polymerase Wzy-like membrane protein
MRTEASSAALGWMLAALVFSLCLGADVALLRVGGLAFRPYLPLLLIAGVVIVARVARRGYLPRVPAQSSFIPLAVLLLAALLSIFNAEYADQAVTQIIFLMGMIGIYGVLIYAQLEPRDLRRIVLAIIWSLTAAVLFGFLYSALEYGRTGSVLLAFAQFRSFFEERNEFGLFMVYGAGFLIPFALNDNAPARYKLLLALTTVALLLNFSRGSLLALTAMVVVDRLGAGRLFAPRPAGRSLLAMGALGLAGFTGLFLLLPTLVQLPEVFDFLVARSVGFSASGDETTSIRLLFIRTAGRAVLSHPFIGNGIGNVGYVLNQYGRAADYGTVTFQGAVRPPVYDLGTTSNLFADLLLESGLLGLLAFLTFLAAVARAAFVPARTGQGTIGLIHNGAVLALVGLLINGLSYNSIYLPFTWVSLGLAVVAAGWLRQTTTSAPPTRAAPEAG